MRARDDSTPKRASSDSPDNRRLQDELSTLRNVGPKTREDFRYLGIETVAQLADREADELYEHLSRVKGCRLDPCVHDVFSAAIHQARTGEALPWWHFSSIRKKEAVGRKAKRNIVRIFVYGTLKRGGDNHGCCAHADRVEPATVWGRLYDLPAGYPALEIPENAILAQGTGDPLADAGTQAQIRNPQFERPEGDWGLVRGELMTFADPRHDLPPIDRVEGFRPGKRCLYRRVLVAARTATGIVPAWLYRMEKLPAGAVPVPGEWKPKQAG